MNLFSWIFWSWKKLPKRSHKGYKGQGRSKFGVNDGEQRFIWQHIGIAWMLPTNSQPSHPTISMTLILSAFIEVKLSISWPLNHCNFLFLLLMAMKCFGPFHNYIRPLKGASFGDFFGLILRAFWGTHTHWLGLIASRYTRTFYVVLVSIFLVVPFIFSLCVNFEAKFDW